MIKKNLCLILVLTLLFFAVGATSVCALDLKIGDVTVSSGETFDVQVTFSETTSLMGGEFDIAYDDSVLTFNNGTPPATHGLSRIGLIGDVSGVVKVMVAGMSADYVDVVATLNFTLAEGASGTTSLTFADTSVGFYDDTNYDDPIPFTPVNGMVSVGGHHSADYNPSDYEISLSETLRIVQIHTLGSYSCDSDGEDGYVAGGDTDRTCTPHDSDYNPQDWEISLSELLRIIQFYHSDAYHADPTGEDGFSPETTGDPPGDLTVTHSSSPANYMAGQDLTITTHIEYSGSISALGAEIDLPEGWTYVTNGGEDKPSGGNAPMGIWNFTGSQFLTARLISHTQ